MSTAPQQSPNLPSLTGLRFLAVLTVFFSHWLAYVPVKPHLLYNMLADIGAMGVQFFFILSGFVLTWSHRNFDTATTFYRRRIARLYPAYAIALLISLLVLHPHASLEQIVPSLVWLQSWSWNKTINSGASPVFWTLSVEAFFYLCFPFIIRKIERLETRKVQALIAIMIVVTVAWMLGMRAFFGTGYHGYWLGNSFPPSRLCEFVLGCALAQWVRLGGRVRMSTTTALALCGVALLITGLTTKTLIRPSAITPFVLLIVCSATADLNGKRSMWNTSSVVKLGEWSYCIYLFHLPALVFAGRYIGVDDGFFGGLVFCVESLALGILISALVSHFVEKPVAKRFSKRRVPALR
jgi:peptidoglycan/LPS O-acetylase OafA/YrhL